MNNFIFNSKMISLSQSEDGTKLFGKILVCPLDEGNANGKGIKKADLTDEHLKRLIGQPIVCKVIKNADGYDFGSHEMKKVREYNSETGQYETKVTFGTNPIGHFTSAYVEDIEINGAIKSCIVADVTFWTRYDKAMEVLVSLFDNGNLSTSWELYPEDKYVEDGIEWIKGIVWIGVAVLGSKVTPAYKDSGVIELSEAEDKDLELIQAFTEDLINERLQTSSSEGGNINNFNEGGIDKMNKNIEKSSVSMDDLYSKVRKAINSIDNYKYYYVPFIYPLEFRAIAYNWERESDQDFIEVKYTVNSDETISIVSQEPVQMVFVPKATIDAQLSEKDNKIAELEGTLAQKETQISEKVDNIVKLGEELASKEEVIKTKESEIAELLPYKEKVTEIEKAQMDAELAEKKENLKKLAIKGGYISSEEIETSEEIKAMIESLDEKGIKLLISERVIAKADENKTEKTEVETSETHKEEKTPTVNLNSATDTKTPVDIAEVMSKYLDRK